MFNSNLTSSISGWLTNTFQGSSEESGEMEKKNLKDSNIATEASEIPPNNIHPEAELISTEKESGEGTTVSESTILSMDAEQVQKKLVEETQKMMSSAKSFGTYLFGVATEAGKKVSTTVNETASTFKKTVEEKTIFGDLNREQDDFIRKKREKQGADGVVPWYGYHEEEAMKQQILALSNDSRNFLRSPPSGVQFQFDFDQMYPVAMATLKEDENLTKMRFKLVPTKIKEEIFWKNYFYRVSLIKQSAQLSTLTEMQKSSSVEVTSSESSASSIVLVNSATADKLSRASSSKSLNKNEADASNLSQSRVGYDSPDLADTTDDLPNAEFASDAFDSSLLNPDDLEREMKELGMSGEAGVSEWEQELQKELQDYEVVNENKKDDEWEKELDSMLTGEESTSG